MGSNRGRHRGVTVRGQPGRAEGLRTLPPAVHVHGQHRLHGRRRRYHPERAQTRRHTSALVPPPPRPRLRRVLPELDRERRSRSVRKFRERRRHAGRPCSTSPPSTTSRRCARGKRPDHDDHARPSRGHQSCTDCPKAWSGLPESATCKTPRTSRQHSMRFTSAGNPTMHPKPGPTEAETKTHERDDCHPTRV